MTRPSGRRDEPAGRGPVRVGQRLRRRDQPGLLEVELRERHPAPRPELAQPRLEVGVDGRRLAAGPRRSPPGSGRPASGRGRRSRRRGRPVRGPARNAVGHRRRGRPAGPSGRPTRTPRSVRARASSPAFVSRVSPTVSSVPMLSSSAVSSGRRRHGRTSPASVASARPARAGARLDRLLSSRLTPATDRAQLGARSWTTQPTARPRSTPDRRPPPSTGRPRPAGAPARTAQAAARDSAPRSSATPRCARWRSSSPTSNWPRPRRRAIAGEVGRVAALGALAIALVIFAVFLARHRHCRCSSGSGSSARWAGASSTASCFPRGRDGLRPRSPSASRPRGSSGRWPAASSSASSSASSLGLHLPNQAYAAIGDATALHGIEPGIRPLVVGLLIGGVHRAHRRPLRRRCG